MIELNAISKRFYEIPILENFSYCFSDKGMYTLWGVSGSGKTTFLNILMGIESYQSGVVSINGIKYYDKVNFDEVQSLFSYIAQDYYFVDYLTMRENLEMLCIQSDDFKKLNYYLKKFQLENKVNHYPKQLSGGERQRFSFIQSILRNTKILVLDEPTSSLDPNNKQLIIEILNELKEEFLIICATHDHDILEISDYIIDMNNLENYNKNDKIIKENSDSVVKKISNYCLNRKLSIKRLIYYMMKKEISPNREKKSSILFIIILVLTLLTCFACSNYESKLISGILSGYKVNAVKVKCLQQYSNECQKILDNSGANTRVRSYLDDADRILSKIGLVDGGYIDTFELGILTVPNQKELFRPAEDKLLYGNYFESSNQIILGYDIALKLAVQYGISLEKLIGLPYILELPAGNHEFSIGGIFESFTIENEYYLRGIFEYNYPFDSYIYVSSEFYNNYFQKELKGKKIDDDNYMAFLYFDKSIDLYNFYNENRNSSFMAVSKYTNGFLDYESKLNLLITFALPIVFCMLIFSNIFYYQTRKIEFAYHQNEILIYQYYGFPSKSIRIATYIGSILSLLIKFSISFIISIILALVLNATIKVTEILPFQPFQLNFPFIILLLLFLGMNTIISSTLLFNHFHKKGWFNILKERRDLL